MIFTELSVDRISGTAYEYHIHVSVAATKKEVNELYKTFNDMSINEQFSTVSKHVDKPQNPIEIKKIAYCDEPGNEKVIVIFKDEQKIIKKMLPGDKFDLNIGVALAVMEKIYGSRSKYHREIQQKLSQK